MKFKKITYTLLVVAVSFSALNLSGCGEKVALKDYYSDNMSKLLYCYNLYMSENNYVGPKNEEELKDFLKNDPTAVFLMNRSIEVTPDNVDDLFVSDRDGEPFVLRYGLKGENDHAVIFEKTGVDGKRLIALSEPQAFDSDMYDKYLAGKIKAAGPTGDYQDDADVADAEADKAAAEAAGTAAE